MYSRIVLPSDLHNLETSAVKHVHALATQQQSSVLLLHVIELIQGIEHTELKDFYADLQRAAEKKLSILAKSFLDSNIPCETATRFGNRPRSIVSFASEKEADVIVLQSHRVTPETASQGWDTISYHVAIFAQCPVLLIK